MKKKILIILLCFLCLGLTACGKKEVVEHQEEKFLFGTTLDDGRLINFAIDVPYNGNSLNDSLLNNEISVEDFVNKLEYTATYKDGGSTLYKYNKIDNEFGNEPFYVIVCNTLDRNRNIYVAKYKENLINICSTKIDDLEGVSMTIKEGTLTRSGATIIITDTTSRDNIYGSEFKLDKKENDRWQEMEIIFDGNYAWTSKGYMVDKNNKLEMNVDWEWLYGKLEDGKYRLVKKTSEPGEGTEHHITVEFEIK
ncbi:MAG: hypothetical protein J1F35_04080 [Erysipelotrichales bacterium]|nr:hypothetical protein [Erysipelotrichales bacterium]